MWIIGQTIAVSQGAPSPAVAVDTYLMALSYDNDAALTGYGLVTVALASSSMASMRNMAMRVWRFV